MKKIIILTGSELRHRFFRKILSCYQHINVLRSYTEGLEGSLKSITENNLGCSEHELIHLKARENIEKDFFGVAEQFVNDQSNSKAIIRGSLNNKENVKEIIDLNPDVIVSYGCSIIKEPLLSVFKGRFINLHLGLSPYYRGSGTNFWPLVNAEPEYLGVTFMHIDAGIDTGSIIHQIRPRIFEYDGPHQIGNRLIADMVDICAMLLKNFNQLDVMQQLVIPKEVKVYRNKDFSEEATQRLYKNFESGMIKNYLDNIENRCTEVPIIENTSLKYYE